MSLDMTKAKNGIGTNSFLGQLNFDDKTRRNETTRMKYTLRPDPENGNSGMYEIPPPSSSQVLGGQGQSQQTAPVQFYRFT